MRIFPKGFTLMELLVVVAIIAILSAIALPNFLEAQTRSKISRAYADMRALTTGLVAYRIDYRNYPRHIASNIDANGPELRMVSTPIAYITSIPNDPFRFGSMYGAPPNALYYDYTRLRTYKSGGVDIVEFWPVTGPLAGKEPREYECMLFSLGPDKVPEASYTFHGPFNFTEHCYDPTNGTTSGGELYYF